MKFLFIFILSIFLGGCSINQQPKIKKIFQTKSAEYIYYNQQKTIEILLEFKKKLNKRNPSAYSKRISRNIKYEIKRSRNSIELLTNKKHKLSRYQDYLNYAFNNKIHIKNRNDYLILGLYKMLYSSYKLQNSHKLTALSYDLNKLLKAYKNLQILKWKIKNDKYTNGEFLFLTWQNNWQIELQQKNKKNNINTIQIQKLHSIKTAKESVFDSSNCSFEVELSKILLYLELSIKQTGGDPVDISIDILSGLVFIM